MVSAGVAFVLSNDPLEVAFTNAPTSTDRSLTVSRGVIVGAACGSKRDQEAVRSRCGIQVTLKRNLADPKEVPQEVTFFMSRQGVPHELTMQTAERAILYFPKADKSTKSETRALQ